eukprot:g20064.t1
MESMLPRSVLFVEDIEELAAEYTGACTHRGSDGHGSEAEAAAAAGKRAGRADQDHHIFARPSSLDQDAAAQLDVPRVLGDKSDDTPPAAFYSQYRQRCNSAVSRKADLKSVRKGQETRHAARQAVPSAVDGGRGGDRPSMALASSLAAAKRKSRSPTGEAAGRTALLSRLNSSLASASSRTSYQHQEDQFVRKRYDKLSAVSLKVFNNTAQFPYYPRGASIVLQGDVDEVRQLSRGLLPASQTSSRHQNTVGEDGEPGIRESPVVDETYAPDGGAGGVGGNGADTGNDGRSEARDSRRASPLSSRPSSRASSRSTSPPCSPPGSPMSQSSTCGSMAPEYSPVALTEEEAAAAAAATNSLLRGTGGIGAVADLARGATERSGDVGRESEDVGEGSLTLLRQRGVATSTNANEVGHRVAVVGAPGGDSKENTTQSSGREAKQQPDSGKPGKRRGGGRSKPKSTRSQKLNDTIADKGGRGRGNPNGDNRTVVTRPSSLDNTRDTDKGTTSPLRDRRGSSRSRSGSPRGRGRRRRGTGHGGPHDGQAGRHPRAGDGNNAQGAIESAAGDDCDTRRRAGRAEEAVTREEAGIGPDPSEAENMLQALAGLSTTLRRLNRAEEGADRVANASAEHLEERIFRSAPSAMEMGGGGSRHQPTARSAGGDHVPAVDGLTSAFTFVDGVGDGGHPASTSPPPPCERCLLLSETVEELRERARMQQRLLEHSDKLLVVSTQRPDGRLEAATPASAATVPVEAHGAPPIGGGAPATNANRDGGGQGNNQPGASVHTGTAAETEGGAAPTALTDEENKELLAAAEAVWRVSELARSALEEELDRREDALAAAARAARESKEALSEQMQEVARLKVALRSKEEEAEKWKGEAEKSSSKEKDSRRAMESTKVAAADALRRSEREGKALRTEADSLKDKVAALRTRLAGLQARRQAECELAAKKSEQMRNTANSLENALDTKRPRQPQPLPQPQLQPQQEEQQHHPEAARFFSAAPWYTNDQSGGGGGGGGGGNTTPRRRYSSAPRGGGEISLESVREFGGRRRTYGSPAEVEAAGAPAAVWERYYEGVGAGQVEDGAQHFSEEEGSLELPPEGEGELEERGGLPWSPGRQSSAWEEGGRRGGAGPVIAARNRACSGGGGGGGGVRRMSTTAPPLSLSGRSSLSPPPSSPRVPGKSCFGTAGGGGGEAFRGGDGSNGRRRSSRGGGGWSATSGGGSAPSGVRRRVSSRMAVEAEEERWAPAPGYRKPRRVSTNTPERAEKFTEAARKADIERLLRRASQSHPPPAAQPRDKSEDGERREGKRAPGGWRGLLKAALSLGGDQAKETSRDYDGQGQALDVSESRSLEEGDGGGGDGGGHDVVIEQDCNDPREEVASRVPRDAETSPTGRGPGWDQEERGGNGDTDRGERTMAGEGAEGERQEAVRRPELGNDRRRNDSFKDGVPKVSTNGKKDESCGEDGGGISPETGKETVDTAPADSSQKVQPAPRRPDKERDDAEPEKRRPEERKVGYRPPPEELWRSAQGRALSSSELEGVLDRVTEQEAERLLRDQGMIDWDGNLKPPSSKS